MKHRLEAPFSKEKLSKLRAGDTVLITGTIYSARDAAHQRLTALLAQKKPLPFQIKDAILYYVGPTPEKPGRPIGSAGPTTSYRMDAYAPQLLDAGQAAMIGKGQRSEEVKAALARNGAVYFAAIGGAGALMAQRIKSSETIAFEELGAEAIRKMTVEDFPVIVINDSRGNDFYVEGRAEYLKGKGD